MIVKEENYAQICSWNQQVFKKKNLFYNSMQGIVCSHIPGYWIFHNLDFKGLPTILALWLKPRHVTETQTYYWNPNKWLKPKHVTETKTCDWNQNMWLETQNNVTETQTSDWNPNMWLKPKQVTETQTCDWNQKLWPKPRHVTKIQTCD